MTPIIAPSILASDFANLQKEVEMINTSQADWVHVDVMDGVFVPNISMGLPVVEAVKRHAKKPLDVHLMIVQPEKYVEAFHKAGADTISVHIEACPHLHRNIQQIKALGCKAGVAVNPHTAVSGLTDLIQDIDLVCLMSVNPGFGGQEFIYEMLPKIQQADAWRRERNLPYRIAADGGINFTTAADCARAGADVFVSGTTLFGQRNLKAAVQKMRQIVTGAHSSSATAAPAVAVS